MTTASEKPATPLRVLLVVFTRSSLGHVTRTTAAAQRLAAAGHQVLLACHPSAAAVPEAAGVPWVQVDEIPPAPVWHGLHEPEKLRAFARTRLASPAYVETCLTEELALIDSWAPDVVVADMRSTAGVAASMRGVPSCSLQNLRLFVHPLHIVLPEVVSTLRGLGVAEQHARRVLGDVLLVPDVPVLDRLCDLPAEGAAVLTAAVDGIRHVGPLVTKEVVAAATAPRSPRTRGRAASGTHVLVTLGGSGLGLEDVRTLVPVLLDAGCSLHVVLGTGTDEEARAVRAQFADAGRSGLIVSGYRRDTVRLIRAADVAVVHGGHASLLEGLLSATPLVLVPHSKEQQGNAARLEQLGLGRAVSRDDAPHEIVAAVVGSAEGTGLHRRESFARYLAGASDGAGLVAAVVDLVAQRRAVGAATLASTPARC